MYANPLSPVFQFIMKNCENVGCFGYCLRMDLCTLGATICGQLKKFASFAHINIFRYLMFSFENDGIFSE